MKDKVLIIVGPTAAGKTAVAVEVAKTLGGEIVALDSRQVYDGMEVGTAQPSEEDREGIPHHLYGVLPPDRSISAGEYALMAEERIKEIVKRGNQPIVSGGSGLYFRALTQGLFEESGSDPAVRKRLQRELKEKGPVPLLENLREIDPKYAEIVHPNNHKRLLRAMEIYEMTGMPPSDHFRRQGEKSGPFHYFSVYLAVSMVTLETRIKERTEMMIQKGWVEEVKRLLAHGFGEEAHPMDSLGYGQIAAYLDGRISYDEMVDRIHIETRQFAKKQVKWFNREEIDVRLDTQEDASGMAKVTVEAYQKDLMETA